MRPKSRTLTTLLGATLLAGACQVPESASRPVGGTSTSRSANDEQLCQPFPDQLFDGFLTAYRERDLEALTSLVRAEEIHDFTAIAAAGRVGFDDVAEWAQAGWEADDRLKPLGYGAFEGGPDNFVMYLTRRNDALRDAGISELSILLRAGSSGCTIDEFSVVGPAQARGAPCRFYEVFGSEAAVAADVPPSCVDGSSAYARVGHASVWTGTEMVVVGGTRGGLFYPPDRWERGLRFHPSDSWHATVEAPSALHSLTRATWTGREVLLWGGSWDDRVAGAYDPADDRWRVFAESPLRRAEDPPGVWTGDELVVWGSSTHTDQPQRRAAILDPETDSWRWSAHAPIVGRAGHVAVWTGNEMVVWGGSNFETDLSDGAAYAPATDTWRTIADSPLSPRQDATAVWTGDRLIVWGGSSFGSTRADGAVYDPDANAWHRLPDAPIADRHWHTAVWTGYSMLVWGGHSYRTDQRFRDGAAYDPAQNRWTQLPGAPITARCRHSAIWTGQRMMVYGGDDSCGSSGHIPFGDGAAYDPRSATWIRANPAG